MLYAALTQKQRERFEAELELDSSLLGAGQGALPGQRLPPARVDRCGVPPDPLRDQGARGPRHPPAVKNFAGLPRGMVLVTGPTGSGKSTTLAGLIDLANRTRRDHIMTSNTNRTRKTT